MKRGKNRNYFTRKVYEDQRERAHADPEREPAEVREEQLTRRERRALKRVEKRV